MEHFKQELRPIIFFQPPIEMIDVAVHSIDEKAPLTSWRQHSKRFSNGVAIFSPLARSRADRGGRETYNSHTTARLISHAPSTVVLSP